MDVRIWSSFSELAIEAQGGTGVQCFGGVARQIGRTVGSHIMRDGSARLDPNG